MVSDFKALYMNLKFTSALKTRDLQTAEQLVNRWKTDLATVRQQKRASIRSCSIKDSESFLTSFSDGYPAVPFADGFSTTEKIE